MHGALRALHDMSVNNASMRTVCKCLKRNNGHLITPKFERHGDIDIIGGNSWNSTQSSDVDQRRQVYAKAELISYTF